MGENFGLLRNLLPFAAPGRRAGPSKKPALYILAAIYYNTLSGARRRQDAWLPNGRRWRMKNSIAKSTGVRAG